jgi:autotransporter-associated beta strand protein
MATFTWNANVNQNWNDAGNWTKSGTSTNSFPIDSEDTAIFPFNTGKTNVTVNVSTIRSPIQLNNNMTFAVTTVSSINGNISTTVNGPFTLTKSGTQQLTLAGSTTIGGITVSVGTLINSSTGTLQITNSASGNITNNNSIIFNNLSNIIYSGIISGTSGTLTKSGAGKLTFNQTQTYTGLTTVTADSLQLDLNGGLSSDISLNTGCTLIYNRSSGYTYNKIISGSGNLTKSGSSDLILGGNNTYSGETTLTGGSTILNNTNALGNTSKITFNGGEIKYGTGILTDYSSKFSQSTGQQFRFDTSGNNIDFNTGLISANGTLTKSGTGTLKLKGNNNYNGQTTISVGTLEFDISGATVYDTSSVITGNGNLIKSGTGTFCYLTSAQSFTGYIDIKAGKLKLCDGAFTEISGARVYSGATLSGVGTMGGLTQVSENGTLDPGLSPGVINFYDLSLNSGSTTIFTIYNYDFYNNTWIDGHNQDCIDFLNVTNNLYIDTNAILQLVKDPALDASLLQTGNFEWVIAESDIPINFNHILDMNIYDPALDTTRWDLSLNNTGTRYPVTTTNNRTYQLILTLTNLVCLTPETIVLTQNGYVSITTLNKGDYITTDDNRQVQIKEIYLRKFKANKITNPYIIPKNSIDYNYPPEELKLSGGHLIKYQNYWVLPRLAGVFKQDTSKDIITYYHIKLENYKTDHLVINGGAVVESLTSNNDARTYSIRCRKIFKIKPEIKNLLDN